MSKPVTLRDKIGDLEMGASMFWHHRGRNIYNHAVVLSVIAGVAFAGAAIVAETNYPAPLGEAFDKANVPTFQRPQIDEVLKRDGHCSWLNTDQKRALCTQVAQDLGIEVK